MVIRLSTPADRDEILSFIARMGFNPRDGVTWDRLKMIAMTAWDCDSLIGAIPMEPRRLRIAPGRIVLSMHQTVVAVDPAFRGKGIGSRLQSAIETDTPADVKLLTVFRELPESQAYRWYLRNGFAKAFSITSWIHDLPGSLASGSKIDCFAIDDPALPWDVAERIWASRQGLGKVDPASRRLRDWLEAHPYRARYRFHVLLGSRGAMAILGCGALHSDSARCEIMEIIADPPYILDIIGAIASFAVQGRLSPLRWPLANHDPRAQVARQLGFRAEWPFDLLVKPLDRSCVPLETDQWIYASIEYA